jgi:phosphatidyl-myo-inositol dimannoside synthase
MVCRALDEMDFNLSIVALNDPKASSRYAATHFPRVRYVACERRRSRFVLAALTAVRERPDVVLMEHPNHSALGWLVARLSGAALVVVAHGIEIWRPLTSVRRWAFRRADRVFCVSAITAERAARSNGLARDRARVLHNCLNRGHAVSPTLSQPTSSPSLLTVSRLSGTEGYKGHHHVIRALPTLLRDYPELVYDVVGDGDRRPALQALAVEHGVDHAVRFHGLVSEEALSNRYAQADVFVMPSRSEGFGYVFIEAMAHGKPVVAGNQDAAVEVVRDGVTGYLIDPNSDFELADRLRRLVRDPDLRQRMGLKGAEIVADEFGFDTFRQKLGSYLAEVLNEKRPR